MLKLPKNNKFQENLVLPDAINSRVTLEPLLNDVLILRCMLYVPEALVVSAATVGPEVVGSAKEEVRNVILTFGASIMLAR